MAMFMVIDTFQSRILRNEDHSVKEFESESSAAFAATRYIVETYSRGMPDQVSKGGVCVVRSALRSRLSRHGNTWIMSMGDEDETKAVRGETDAAAGARKKAPEGPEPLGDGSGTKKEDLSGTEL